MKDVNQQIRDLYEAEAQARKEDLRRVLSTPEGKRVIWWLLGRTHIFSSTFTGNAQSHFLEGERNIGLILFRAVLEVDPKLMGAMSQSHAAKLSALKTQKDKLKEGEGNAS